MTQPALWPKSTVRKLLPPALCQLAKQTLLLTLKGLAMLFTLCTEIERQLKGDDKGMVETDDVSA